MYILTQEDKKKIQLQPRTCEELMCKEGLKCKMKSNGESRQSRSRKAVCIQIHLDIPRPTAVPIDLPIPTDAPSDLPVSKKPDRPHGLPSKLKN